MAARATFHPSGARSSAIHGRNPPSQKALQEWPSQDYIPKSTTKKFRPTRRKVKEESSAPERMQNGTLPNELELNTKLMQGSGSGCPRMCVSEAGNRRHLGTNSSNTTLRGRYRGSAVLRPVTV